MLRDISPPAVAYAARCNACDIRHWRSHCMIDGIGERIGKGHLYSSTEAACIAIAAFIARHGIGFREAFRIVGDRRAQIDELVKGQLRSGHCDGSDYVLTFALDPDISNGYRSITGAPIARCALGEDVAGALQVNLSLIIRSVVDRLAFCEKHLSADMSDAA